VPVVHPVGVMAVIVAPFRGNVSLTLRLDPFR
jgi:hypothetical protein